MTLTAPCHRGHSPMTGIQAPPRVGPWSLCTRVVRVSVVETHPGQWRLGDAWDHRDCRNSSDHLCEAVLVGYSRPNWRSMSAHESTRERRSAECRTGGVHVMAQGNWIVREINAVWGEGYRVRLVSISRPVVEFDWSPKMWTGSIFYTFHFLDILIHTSPESCSILVEYLKFRQKISYSYKKFHTYFISR